MDKPHRKKPEPKKSSSHKADRGKASTADTHANDAQDQQPDDKSFPIVGIGASAGGLEAFNQLFKALPADTGMGFVVVQHLAPKHESALTEILSRATKMLVTEVRNGMPVEPDHVYVIPPDTNMAILHGRLNLMPRANVIGQHMPIDYFLRTLA
jgi:two-component system CheB/CheR fusion protein